MKTILLSTRPSPIGLLLGAVLALGIGSAHAALIIYDGFNYPLATVAPDPDGGLNSGNGFPATNPGNPSNTSTGLRGAYGGLTVVAGLTYSNSGGTLDTSGNAVNSTTAGTNGQVNVYRNVSPDPFLSQRIGDSNSAAFGKDGTSLFYSFLAQTSSTTPTAFRLRLSDPGPINIDVQNTATGYQLAYNGAGVTTPLESTSAGSYTVGSPTFLVLRIDFAAGAADAASLYINPTLGQPLGTADTSLTGLTFDGFNRLQSTSTVAGAMTYDEFRMGTTAADVMPIPEPTTVAMLVGGAGMLLLRRRRR